MAAVSRWTGAGGTRRHARAGGDRPAPAGGSGVLDPRVVAGLQELDRDRMAQLVGTFTARTLALLEQLQGGIEAHDGALVSKTCHT